MQKNLEEPTSGGEELIDDEIDPEEALKQARVNVDSYENPEMYRLILDDLRDCLGQLYDLLPDDEKENLPYKSKQEYIKGEVKRIQRIREEKEKNA